MRSGQEETAAADPNCGVDGRKKTEVGARQPVPRPEWTRLVGPAEWEVYQPAIQGLREGGIRFVLGGAFGLAANTGHWRNTKDLDFFVLPADREKAVERLTGLGFTDYYPTLAYDRGWIYRATRSGVIVDVIWGTPNRRTEGTSSGSSMPGNCCYGRRWLTLYRRKNWPGSSCMCCSGTDATGRM